MADIAPGTSVAFSDDNPASSDKKLESIAAREQRIAKREKEITAKMTELERKLKVAEDQEEKLGSLAQRELLLEQANNVLQQNQKDVKRREKTVKEQEASLSEREGRVAERDQQLATLDADLNNRAQEISTKEATLERDLASARSLTQSAQERMERLDRDSELLRAKEEELQNLERTLKRRETNLLEDDADLQRKKKEAKEREEALEKLQQQLAARQTAITAREVQNQSERDRLNRLTKHLEEDERNRAAANASLAATRDEVQRMQAAADAARQAAAQEREEADHKIAELEKKIAQQDRLMVENLQLQREIAATKSDVTHLDNDLKKRERRYAADVRELEQREAQIQKKKMEMDQSEAQLRSLTAALAEQRQQFEVEKLEFQDVRVQHEKDFAALGQMEQQWKRRLQSVQAREETLAQWMREMEWRESFLTSKEDIVDRVPFPLASPAGGNTSKAEGGSDTLPSGGVAAARRRSSVSPSSLTAAANDEADNRRAFGKALVDVQLRRLKEQYVSAQLQWATLEVEDRPSNDPTVAAVSPAGGRRASSAGPLNEATQHRRLSYFSPAALRTRVRTKSGIDADASTANHGVSEEEIERQAAIHSHRANVHRMGNQLVRSVAKLHIFESLSMCSFVCDQSQPLPLEQAVPVAFALNFEQLTKHIDVAVGAILSTCPLDERDAAVDAKDLLQKTIAWWHETRGMLETRLVVLLADRKRYLNAAMNVVEAVTANRPSSSGEAAHRRESRKSLVSGLMDADPFDRDRGDEASCAWDELQTLPTTTDSAPHNSSTVPRVISRSSSGASLLPTPTSHSAVTSSAVPATTPSQPPVTDALTQLLNSPILAPRAAPVTKMQKMAAIAAAAQKPSFSPSSRHVTPPRQKLGDSPSAAPQPSPVLRPASSGGLSVGGCGGARGDFHTMTEEATFCLMKTGRAESAGYSRVATSTLPTSAPAHHCGTGGATFSLPSAVVAASKGTRRHMRHDFRPPATWGPEHPVTIPKVLSDHLAAEQKKQAAAGAGDVDAAGAADFTSPTSPSPSKNHVTPPRPNSPLAGTPAARPGTASSQQHCPPAVLEGLVRNHHSIPSPYLAPVVARPARESGSSGLRAR